MEEITIKTDGMKIQAGNWQVTIDDRDIVLTHEDGTTIRFWKESSGWFEFKIWNGSKYFAGCTEVTEKEY